MSALTRSPHAPVLWRGLDRTLVITVLMLIAVGLTLSLAASPAAADRLAIDDPFHFVYRHGLFAIAALAILGFTAALSVRGARRLAGLALAGSLLVMAALPFIGHEVNGSTRWLRLGSFSLQPSEFFKPAFIVVLAWLFSEESRGAPAPGRLIGLGIYLLGVGLFIIQPDFGQTVLITLLFGALLFAAGLPWLHMAGLGAMALAGGALAYFALPHVRDRILDFVGPGGDRMQTETALEAISRGGLMGVGPGEGEVKRLLPEAYNDFIFSVAAEEFGLIASLAIIGRYLILFLRAWSSVMRLTDHFAQLATAGLAMLFALQALINIAVNLSLIPPKGMTLPFVSHGGSSMLALAFAAGLMLALTRRRPGAFRREG